MAQNTVSAEFTLPCGCVVLKRVVLDIDPTAENDGTDPATYRMQLDHATHLLGGWFESRVDRHQCELVSDENPYGLARRQ